MMIRNSKHKKIVNKIELIRKKNNKNWMDLLRIALETNPKKAAKVLKKINTNDMKISNLMKKFNK